VKISTNSILKVTLRNKNNKNVTLLGEMQMIGERLQRARKGAGVSLRVLADQSDLSHTTIDKFEKEKLKPSSSQLIKMAKVLGVRMEYFFRPQVIEIQTPEYRKKTTLAKKVLNQIEGDIFDQAERWHELLNLYPTII
jgi:transcriptional regulator with XRE-family HTH domain